MLLADDSASIAARPAAAPDTELVRFAQRALWVLVAAILGLAVAGAFVTAGVLRGHDEAAPVAKGPFTVADDVPASFGFIAVESVKKMPGLTPRSVASATHAIPGFVPAGKAGLDLAVTLRNTTRQPVVYDPRRFRLQVGSSKALLAPVSASIRRGRLEVGATLDGVLRFVTPAKRQRLRVLFDDPLRKAPTVIDLGAVKNGTASSRSRPDDPAAPDSHSDHGH